MSPEKDGLAAALAGVVGAGKVRDAEGATVGGVAPGLVVRPADVEEVRAVLAFANDNGLRLTPTGGGTTLDLGNRPERVDVLLDLSALDKVTEYDAENLTVAAQAGVKIVDLVERAAADNLLLPLDPAFAGEATIGGVVAAGENGPKRLLRGHVRDLVLGLKVVLPSGELVKFGGRTIKNVSGYDVTKLMIGSLGILGVIVEVTLRLLPAAEREDVLVQAFPELEDVGRLTAQVLDSILAPSALELVSPRAREFLGDHVPTGHAPGQYLLLTGLDGHPDAVTRQERDLTALRSTLTAEAGGCLTFSDPVAVGALWKTLGTMRNAAEAAGFTVASRVAVPISAAWEIAAAAEKSAGDNGLQVAYKISAGNGIVDLHLKGEANATRAVLEGLRALAESREGSLVLRCAPAFDQEFEAWGTPRADLPVVKAIKAKYDPKGVLNVGRFYGRV